MPILWVRIHHFWRRIGFSGLSGVRSVGCKTNLRVGINGLADVAESRRDFYYARIQRATVPKNTGKIAIDLVMAQKRARLYVGIPQKANFLRCTAPFCGYNINCIWDPAHNGRASFATVMPITRRRYPIGERLCSEYGTILSILIRSRK